MAPIMFKKQEEFTMELLKAEIRDEKAKAKRLRREGFVPGCIYGPKLEKTILFKVTKKDAGQVFRKKTKGNMLEVLVEDNRMVTILDEVSIDVMRNEIEHISLHVLDEDKKVERTARVDLINKDLAAGIPEQELEEIPYSSLPADFEDVITVDLSGCEAGTVIKVADLDISKNDKIDLLVDSDQVVAKVVEKGEQS